MNRRYTNRQRGEWKSWRPTGGSWVDNATRYAIYERDGWTCAYCGIAVLHATEVVTDDDKRRSITLDHIIPIAKWLPGASPNDPTNLITCCSRCNFTKQDRTAFAFVAAMRDEDKRKAALKRLDRAQTTDLDRKLGLMRYEELKPMPQWQALNRLRELNEEACS